MTDLSDMRRDYAGEPLDIGTVAAEPAEQFRAWFAGAVAAKVMEPNAAALATADADGTPSCRMVLLKQYDVNGFVFFTNYRSRKGRELEQNPRASLLFFWPELSRQVRIEGRVTKTTDEESDLYFAARPRSSSLSALVSQQSRILESRATLERLCEQAAQLYNGKALPRPNHWGGYRLIAAQYEFWQGHPDRLHDRINYTAKDGGWTVQRLWP